MVSVVISIRRDIENPGNDHGHGGHGDDHGHGEHGDDHGHGHGHEHNNGHENGHGDTHGHSHEKAHKNEVHDEHSAPNAAELLAKVCAFSKEKYVYETQNTVSKTIFQNTVSNTILNTPVIFLPKKQTLFRTHPLSKNVDERAKHQQIC